MAASRCCATTKSGTRCSITSLSSMRDAAGRFVAEPLRKGGSFCMMHTLLFPKEPARACESIVAYIDLETNSLDVLSGRILEVGALVDSSRAMFSTVVNPGCHTVHVSQITMGQICFGLYSYAFLRCSHLFFAPRAFCVCSNAFSLATCRSIYAQPGCLPVSLSARLPACL